MEMMVGKIFKVYPNVSKMLGIDIVYRLRASLAGSGACRRVINLSVLLFWVALCMLPSGVHAKSMMVWTGNISNDWNMAANWSSQVVPGAADDVQIGVAAFVNQPVVGNDQTCASIRIGSIQSVSITINAGATLTVIGAVVQGHGSGNMDISTTISGQGSLTCGSLLVGDATPGRIVEVKKTELVCTLAHFTVTGNVFINSMTTYLLSGGLVNHNGYLSLQSGELKINGQIRLTSIIPAFLSGVLATVNPMAKLSIDPAPGQEPRLKVLGNKAVTINDARFNTVDFFNLTGNGQSIVEYAGADQTIATAATAGVDRTPMVYQDLVISGSGIKNTENNSGDSLLTAGYLRILAGTLNTQDNNAYLSVGGDFSNAGTVKLSKAAFFGGNFSNTGQVSTGNDTLFFAGNNQALHDTTANGTALKNVVLVFGTKTIAGGSFILPAGGYWKVAGSSTAVSLSPGAQLVFRSDNTGQSVLVFSTASTPYALIFHQRE